MSHLTAKIERAWPPESWVDTHVVVAVSGGADSVGLLRGLRQIKQRHGGRGKLIVAHYDHALRGEASAADAQWVHALAKRLDLSCIQGQHADGGLSSEQHARDARYRWLLEASRANGARVIATGHTADDQAETILHRLLRGASLAGLAGIPFCRLLDDSASVVRPLLEVTRQQVEAYLGSLGQAFRTDATNGECRFTRNRLRNRVLPLLREEFGEGVDAAIRRAGRHASEAHALIERMAADLAAVATSTDREMLRLDARQLTDRPPLVCREACKLAWRRAGWPEQDMGAAEWDALHALLANADQASSLNLPGGVNARWNAGLVSLVRNA